MRRLSVTALIMLVAPAIFAAPALGAHRHASRVVDHRYLIAFHLPARWNGATVTKATKGPLKVVVEDLRGTTKVGVIEVSVLAGHKVSAAGVAAAIRLLGGTPTGSRVRKFRKLRAEQLTFSVPPSAAAPTTVYGTYEAFFTHHRTYYIAFISTSRAINNAAVRTVMRSWS